MDKKIRTQPGKGHQAYTILLRIVSTTTGCGQILPTRAPLECKVLECQRNCSATQRPQSREGINAHVPIRDAIAHRQKGWPDGIGQETNRVSQQQLVHSRSLGVTVHRRPHPCSPHGGTGISGTSLPTGAMRRNLQRTTTAEGTRCQE